MGSFTFMMKADSGCVYLRATGHLRVCVATEKQPAGTNATGYYQRHLHFSGDESRQLRKEEEEDEDAAEDGNCRVGEDKRRVKELKQTALRRFYLKHDSEMNDGEPKSRLVPADLKVATLMISTAAAATHFLLLAPFNECRLGWPWRSFSNTSCTNYTLRPSAVSGHGREVSSC